MDKSFLSRLTFWKSVAIILITLGLYSVFIRFTGGLGAATNLSDEFPWGLWLGFNILCGVGLSAGGFTLCGIVYIFNLKDFKPLVRPAILTAFLGYLLVITALMIELGRPDKIWHTLIMWNPRSVMFEVAWCVMLYTTVLALEFSPIVLERLGWKTPLKIIKSITIPLVIAGVLLSTLHQSSLGSLYLIVPNKLYGLWYSELLPVFFFISALTVGCGMVIIESYLSSRTFKRELEFPLLLRLGQVMVILIMVNVVVKFIDLMDRNSFDLLFLNRTETYLYWLEVFLGLIVPFIMMNFKKIRFNRAGLFYSALFVILGFILNRMNVSVTGMESGSGASYLPSWMEVFITMAIVSLGFVAFTLIGKYFPVFSEVHTPPNKNSQISKYIV
ncbi:MAG: Ni/Fe-hydrogenase cytochrome b subunit [Bacteroidetes bacterium]|nr:Ni/Fe-hydrogenase cytochrome b subunit [Bacteroidota bacterium]MBU1423595.1 Ni/Fe-hydrogenase cytochrome b subunit [Bacteroidota bacterium]MBU2472078.1 Ni/Fe-hydrogenase cytochrome b subunit [Bacteroidota bacterium]MBU2635789.1 Ni/Fe-hydrogenase cytochrome b subunit [Bacteroidota bacterium]